MIVLPSERRGRGYDSIESCDRLPLSQTLLAVVLFLPLSPPIDQRQGAIRTEIESRDSGNGRLPGVLVRFASDSPLEGDGFELAVPRKSDIGLGEVIISRAREERVVAGPQDFLLAAPLFRVCPFSLRGWRLFVRVVPVLFSTALITSLSARRQKFLA